MVPLCAQFVCYITNVKRAYARCYMLINNKPMLFVLPKFTHVGLYCLEKMMYAYIRSSPTS